MEALLLENQSWLQVKEYLEKNNIILIPIGSIENEGNHLPLGLDIHLSRYLCEEVSKKTGCIVGPCLSLGYSKWFMDFPGTISLEHNTLTILIKEYCNCLYIHGFRNFVFINPHMGNATAIADIGRDFRKMNALVTMVDIWRTLEKISKDNKLTEKSELSHGGEIGTSIALAMYPNNTIMAKAQKAINEYPVSKNIKPVNTIGLARFKGKNIYTYVSAKEITTSGLLGDPSKGTKEKGRILIKAMVLYLEKVITELQYS